MKPVNGFFGANALKNYRIEIDYKNSVVYFSKSIEVETHEMDMMAIYPEYQRQGVAQALFQGYFQESNVTVSSTAAVSSAQLALLRVPVPDETVETHNGNGPGRRSRP